MNLDDYIFELGVNNGSWAQSHGSRAVAAIRVPGTVVPDCGLGTTRYKLRIDAWDVIPKHTASATRQICGERRRGAWGGRWLQLGVGARCYGRRWHL